MRRNDNNENNIIINIKVIENNLIKLIREIKQK